MSLFYLVNDVSTLRAAGLLPGAKIDDASTYNGLTAAQIRSAGGVLWPTSDTFVAAAATLAQGLHKQNGVDEGAMAQLMLGGVAQSLISGGGVALATDPVAEGAIVKHLQIDLPLATLQAMTSGTEVNVSAPLPANAQLLSSQINVVQVLGGGTVSAAALFLQQATKTAGEIEGGASGVDGHTAAGVFHGAGSNPYPTRGGQQLAFKATLTGDTMAHLTTGHVQIDLFYSVVA